ncbi:MAG TPA: AAA family ATPase [Acidimicrobiia bacterium]|nr:AAA family ATPase [Acidimicrobiia bacterium]
MTTPASRRLVVVVDADPAFVEDARLLLQGERVLAARTTDEAAEIVTGGRVDLVVLGPSFGNESAVLGAGSLRVADPGVVIVLAANIVTNRILLGAMRSGIADVIDTPLTLRKLDDVLGRVGDAKAPASARPAAPQPEPAQAPAPRPEPPVVTIAFEAESGTATPMSFTPAGAGPRYGDVPPSGPIDEPDAGAGAPVPQAWVVPIVATPQPPAPVTSEPQVGVAAPRLVDQPVPPLAAATVVAPSAPVAPVVAVQQPPQQPPPEEAAPPRSIDVVLPSAFPPPPSTPPPSTRGDSWEPPRYDDAGPIGLERARPLSPDRPGRNPRTGSGRVVAVMAGKGGSGKTITAANLALALTFQHGEDTVVIVDADIQFGDVALMLQLDPSRTLGDAVARLAELSDARLDGMLLRHESGLRILPAPLLPTSEDAIPAKGIVAVIERLRGMYQFVIVDTPPIFDDHLITVLEAADHVLAVVDMDLPSVKNAKIALDALRGSGFPMDRMRLVVNRANAKARLDLVELERSLGLRVAGSIPSDRLVPQSVNEGIPVVALSPRSRVARSFHALAQMVTSEDRHVSRR